LKLARSWKKKEEKDEEGGGGRKRAEGGGRRRRRRSTSSQLNTDQRCYAYNWTQKAQKLLRQLTLR